MVVLPLLYPELFSHFHIAPVRGVIFHGPPGTGKTLVARALANMCDKSGHPIAFFMRKGADCLSKWVGETERQLRLLFEQARAMQPSIIFFDEIDGLAPVRSSKQDQIHSSIVSTLLGLLDGLDDRGQVVVIGATNRIDAIDPALRRPGRFDREFLFPLPSRDARRTILAIHTKKWQPLPSDELLNHLAETTSGYCGADLKALCTEAVLCAVRCRYPQIYHSEMKLLIDPASIVVSGEHFAKAAEGVTPTSKRSMMAVGRLLPSLVAPLLRSCLSSLRERAVRALAALEKNVAACLPDSGQQPRLLVCGRSGDGQSYIGAALLHELERYPVFSLSLSVLMTDPSSKTVEESCSNAVREALRQAPAILYWPDIDSWWQNTDSCTHCVIAQLLAGGAENGRRVLVAATAECEADALPAELSRLFSTERACLPMEHEREQLREFFTNVFEAAGRTPAPPPPRACVPPAESLSPLPLAPVPVPHTPAQQQWAPDAATIAAENRQQRQLRIALREIIQKVSADQQYKQFWKTPPLHGNEEYYERVPNPLSLSIILKRVDENCYPTVGCFLADVEKFTLDAVGYNEDDYDTVKLTAKAKALNDEVRELADEIDVFLVSSCEEAHVKRRREGRCTGVCCEGAPVLAPAPTPASAPALEPAPMAAAAVQAEQPQQVAQPQPQSSIGPPAEQQRPAVPSPPAAAQATITPAPVATPVTSYTQPLPALTKQQPSTPAKHLMLVPQLAEGSECAPPPVRPHTPVVLPRKRPHGTPTPPLQEQEETASPMKRQKLATPAKRSLLGTVHFVSSTNGNSSTAAAVVAPYIGSNAAGDASTCGGLADVDFLRLKAGEMAELCRDFTVDQLVTLCVL
eukprot:TRINITY_DN410_c0_g1_i3.p1 TRINITY_DN410_c0_g1~~TRINITY_DN410_c0_g1_i3.p1  ORF type:complete len:868 (-),score=201.82 TRINITY_DN410_c0_g1_i3:17-2599(-)